MSDLGQTLRDLGDDEGRPLQLSAEELYGKATGVRRRRRVAGAVGGLAAAAVLVAGAVTSWPGGDGARTQNVPPAATRSGGSVPPSSPTAAATVETSRALAECAGNVGGLSGNDAETFTQLPRLARTDAYGAAIPFIHDTYVAVCEYRGPGDLSFSTFDTNTGVVSSGNQEQVDCPQKGCGEGFPWLSQYTGRVTNGVTRMTLTVPGQGTKDLPIQGRLWVIREITPTKQELIRRSYDADGKVVESETMGNATN